MWREGLGKKTKMGIDLESNKQNLSVVSCWEKKREFRYICWKLAAGPLCLFTYQLAICFLWLEFGCFPLGTTQTAWQSSSFFSCLGPDAGLVYILAIRKDCLIHYLIWTKISEFGSMRVGGWVCFLCGFSGCVPRAAGREGWSSIYSNTVSLF